jgi:hypothetical protein
MPTAITRGAMSAKAFGFTSVSLGGAGFIGFIRASSLARFYSLSLNPSNELYLSGIYNGGEGYSNSFALIKINSTGSSITLQDAAYDASYIGSYYSANSGTLYVDSTYAWSYVSNYNGSYVAGEFSQNNASTGATISSKKDPSSAQTITPGFILKDNSGSSTNGWIWVKGTRNYFTGAFCGCCPIYADSMYITGYNSSGAWQSSVSNNNVNASYVNSTTDSLTVDSNGNLWTAAIGSLLYRINPSTGDVRFSFQTFTSFTGYVPGTSTINYNSSTQRLTTAGTSYSSIVTANISIGAATTYNLTAQWASNLYTNAASYSAARVVTDASGNAYTAVWGGNVTYVPNNCFATIVKTNSSEVIISAYPEMIKKSSEKLYFI